VVSLSHAPVRRAAGERGVPGREHAAGVLTAELTDGTLGGYQRVHERAPAFSGVDGESYSVGTYVDDSPDAQGRYGAALLFVRWSVAGDRAVGHLETDYLFRGATPADALAPLLALTLQDVKRHLDQCIEKHGGGGGGGGGGGPPAGASPAPAPPLPRHTRGAARWPR